MLSPLVSVLINIILKSFGGEPRPPEIAFTDQRAAPLVKINILLNWDPAADVGLPQLLLPLLLHDGGASRLGELGQLSRLRDRQHLQAHPVGCALALFDTPDGRGQ